MSESRLKGIIVLIRGAGEMATGVAHRLHRSGFRVIMTEEARPMAVRRAVSFCEAVYDGTKTVEGLTSRRVGAPGEVAAVWRNGEIPLIVDPVTHCRFALGPQVIVDAILAKRNTGLDRSMAPLTIGLGPGFSAPDGVHLVIETHRGHDLGRLIYRGEPQPNTGVPGSMAGYTAERVLRSPADGMFEPCYRLGDILEADQPVARVGSEEVRARVGGVLRGLIRSGTPVGRGTKVGDIDPRGRKEYLYTISEKARAIGGSVLEGILAVFNR
jgi:xanthine dehydrogenase accessory factor